MIIIVTFSGDTANVTKYVDGELTSRKTVRAVGALLWMTRQSLSWSWADDNTATAEL